MNIFCININATLSSPSKINDFNQTFPTHAHFSTYVNYTWNKMQIYISYLGTYGNSNSYYEGINNNFLIGPQGNLYLDNLSKPVYNLVDFNYYRCNDTDFVAVSSSYGQYSTLTIYKMNQNITYSMVSKDPYYIASITQLPNSDNLFFSIYNSTDFLIIEYSFASNQFSIFFKSSKLTLSTEKNTHVSVLTNNNAIFCSISVQDT